MLTALPPPPSLARIAARVDARLQALLDVERQRWRAIDEDLDAPIHEVERLVMAGGKRLRPAFCHWGFVGAGGEPEAGAVIDAGAAFELMHAFALFHDDVMDDAASRRGAPTTHTVFAAEHTRAGWSGEARRFGEGVAILVGDLAFVYADQLMRSLTPAAWDMWNELRIELNIGQFLDILGSVRHDRRLDKAERICRYKSGKYTIERPLHLGAILAAPERSDELVPALSAYGLPLGDAFQMRDDVIGVYGDESITGKPVGGDLREGKPTPLLARAYAAATPAQRAILDTVGAPDMTDHQVASVQQIMIDTGALAGLEAHIESLTDQALAALPEARLTSEATDELVQLAHYVSWRRV